MLHNGRAVADQSGSDPIATAYEYNNHTPMGLDGERWAPRGGGVAGDACNEAETHFKMLNGWWEAAAMDRMGSHYIHNAPINYSAEMPACNTH